MRLELTVDVEQGKYPHSVEAFISSLESWLVRYGFPLVGWRIIEEPDPNEEHSSGAAS